MSGASWLYSGVAGETGRGQEVAAMAELATQARAVAEATAASVVLDVVAATEVRVATMAVAVAIRVPR